MIGTLVNNRYRLDAQIGRGGMGVVYRAHDTLLDRDVALKVLSATALNAEHRARLLPLAVAARGTADSDTLGREREAPVLHPAPGRSRRAFASRVPACRRIGDQLRPRPIDVAPRLGHDRHDLGRWCTRYSSRRRHEARHAGVPQRPTTAAAAELVSTGFIRSQRVAQLRILPFQYNPATRELR